jgi:hypothetical protein
MLPISYFYALFGAGLIGGVLAGSVGYRMGRNEFDDVLGEKDARIAGMRGEMDHLIRRLSSPDPSLAGPDPKAVVVASVPIEVAVAADSLLSWLWHRHTPPAARDVNQRDYDLATSGLRDAYERAARRAGMKLTS